MKRFEGKTILVTGAGSGIGAATVRRLFDEGASVVAADVRKEDVDQVVAEFAGSDRVYGVAVDVSNPEQVAAFVAGAVARFGTLFGLVNCAGIRGVGNILNFDHKAWQQVMAVNLDGTFHTCQAFSKAVKAVQGTGAIVNISSTGGIRGVPNRLAYVASKFGVSGITRSMSLELAPLGIRVNAVAPGIMETPAAAGLIASPVAREAAARQYPLPGIGDPDELAGLMDWLLAPAAARVTGQVWAVDGGFSAIRPLVK